MCKSQKACALYKAAGRTAAEAKRMMDLVEEAGVFAGYLEDLYYTPKFLKSLESVKNGSLGKILWTKSREAHPAPHSDWFWDMEKSGGGAMIGLACHCIEIGRIYIGKNVKPIEVMCWADTQAHPIEAKDHGIGLINYANVAISQFEVNWCFRGWGIEKRIDIVCLIEAQVKGGSYLYAPGSLRKFLSSRTKIANS